MTSFALNTTTTATQTLNGSEYGLLGSSGAILHPNFGIVMNGDNDVVIDGTVQSIIAAINGANASAIELTIGQNGNVLSGGLAITADVSVSSTIVNNGVISSTSNAITLTADNAASGFVAHDIINAGTISSTATGIDNTQSQDGLLEFQNTGVLAGNDLAYHGGNGGDYVDNSGTITGPINFGGGNDRYLGSSGILEGAVFGGSGNDTIIGGAGDDTLDGDGAQDRIHGGLGNDNILGDGGNDTITGGRGDDTLLGGNNNDRVSGGDDNDSIDGGGGSDLLYGNMGDDFIFGGVNAFSDTLYGGSGDDTLDGGDAPDFLYGQAGHDSLIGGSNNDELYGGWGSDTLNGGGGLDELDGGEGDDLLIGGANPDDFNFGRKSGDDTIGDFQDGLDQIDLSALGLAGFGTLTGAGAVSALGGSTLIDLTLVGGEGTILIDGVASGLIGAGDFIF
jgi:Ca2+-binding RTX toxin-like protein